MDGYFTREFEINGHLTLTFYQREVGDVSCVVWDAALVLAKYLERRCKDVKDWLHGRSVLELGAGLGCVGLTAACLGARVIMTDLDEVIPLMEKNVEANKNIWSASGGEICTKSVEPLIQTLCAVTGVKTEIIISQEERDTEKQLRVWKNFQQALQEHFDVIKVPEEDQHPEFYSSDIVILHARKKVGS
ncbi:Protein-lysine methyltransferase METTL21D [Blattella germanica]|nr:Protein-lysine methyltransferase METTL21D [Blattella germanica]